MIWNRKYSGSDSLRDEVNHAGCFGRSRQQPFLTYFSLTVHRKCPYNKRNDKSEKRCRSNAARAPIEMEEKMREMELIAPCHFGLEAVLRREITDLGYEISEVEDGRITFLGDEEAVCRANIFLRTAERVLIKVGSFHAETFEELFQGTKALEWENYIPCLLYTSRCV